MITLTVTEQTAVNLTLVGVEAVTLEAEVSTYVDITQTYAGPYEWTPTQAEQAVPIAGLKAGGDIIINPIPSDWGHIGWDGSILTVS